MGIKEEKDRRNNRRDKISSYFFDLSKLSFAGMVLGGITPMFTGDVGVNNWLMMIFGAIMTYVFAAYANRILKLK